MSAVDVLIYVHPELSAEDRAKVTQNVLVCVGVVAANFDHHKHPHALMVQYDPDKVNSTQILEVVRRYDPLASMAGL